MFIPALSVGVVILGIYIITLHLFMNQPPVLRSDAVFHIGCYDPNYINNHSLELSRRLAKIDESANAEIRLNMYQSKALAPEFQQQVHQLAIAFENYINNYYQFKVRTDQDLHFYNSLQIAKRDFETCAKNQHLDSQACLNDWKNYQASVESFNSLKKDLTNLIGDKQAQERRISAVILEHTDEDQSEIQKKYTTKINQFKQKLGHCEEQIVNFKTRKGKLRQQIDLEQKNLEDLTNLLNQCETNKQLINFCQKISDQILKFKQSVPQKNKSTMQLRITQKRKIIDGLELNLRKIQKYGSKSEVQKAENQLSIQKRELMLLEADVTNFQTTEQSKCAKCSEQKIAQLRKRIISLRETIQNLKKNYEQVTKNLHDEQQTMHELKGQITNAQQARETQINTKFCVDDKCKKQQRQNLLRLQGALNELKKQIIDKQIEINFITNNQKGKLNAMSKYLADIQSATTCLFKKDFYEQLRQKQPQKTDINDNMIGHRDKVMKELNDFEL